MSENRPDECKHCFPLGTDKECPECHIERLKVMAVTKCSCLTKTRDPQYHKHTCPVWMMDRIIKLEAKVVEQLGRIRVKEVVEVIIDGIVEDMCGRKGLDDTWNCIDEEIRQDEIIPAWRGIIREALGGEQ